MMLYINAVMQGFLWGIMGLGLFISFRILHFPDLTSEASFTTGAATAVVAASQGIHPLLVIGLAILAGMVAGWVTGFLATVLKIPGLLASIITMTGLYSVNLAIMGRPNASYRGSQTLFDQAQQWLGSPLLANALVSLTLVLVIISILSYFLKTDLGQSIIATGDNPKMAIAYGIPVHRMKRLALMLANGLIALSGALISQYSGFSDISMGTGTVVVAMAAIVIGEVVFFKEVTLPLRLVSVVIGAVLYRILLVFVLSLGLNPNYFRLISAVVLTVFLSMPYLGQRFSRRPNLGGQL